MPKRVAALGLASLGNAVPDDVQKILGPNEQVQLYIQQKIYHPKISIDSIVITNERVILRHPHAMNLKKDYTDYNYQDIANVVLDKGIMRSSFRLTLRLGGEPLSLDDLPNSDAQSAYGLIRDNLGRYQAPFTPARPYVPGYQAPQMGQPPQTTVIEREVVKVKCRFCGALNDESAKTCVSCGATL